MAEEPKEKIWVKPVLIGIAAAVLWIPLTGSDLTGALIAGVAGVGIGHLVLSRIGGRDAGKGGETGSEARQSQPEPATDTPAVRLVEPAPVTETPATGFAEEAAGFDGPRAATGPADTGLAGTGPMEEAPSDTGPLIKPSTPLPGEAELAARKGSWTYQPGQA